MDERITYEINDAEIQKHDLTPTDQFEIVQHVELLDMPIHVTEHRLRRYLNPDGETFLPHVPELRNQPIFGPRMLTHDRLAQVTSPLQLLDHCDLDG